MGLALFVSPWGVLPVVTSYASPVQCPPVLSGCSAAEATQGTVCEQTSGQSLAAAKESNQRSKGEQCGAIVPRQSQAELSWWGMHPATGSLAGGPGRAGRNAGRASLCSPALEPAAPHPCRFKAPRQQPLLGTAPLLALLLVPAGWLGTAQSWGQRKGPDPVG